MTVSVRPLATIQSPDLTTTGVVVEAVIQRVAILLRRNSFAVDLPRCVPHPAP